MSPAPLPEPPEDYGRLAEAFPRLAKDATPRPWYRLHQVARDPEWFGASGHGRWDPPAPAAELFGTCYLAADPLTALMEGVAELVVVSYEMLDRRALAVIEFPEVRPLADMTDPRIVGDRGLDRRISTGDDYGVCQRWAAALRMAGFGGVFYEPRHDPRGGPCRSLALFGDPGYQPTQLVVVEDAGLHPTLIEQARQVFGLAILPSGPLI